MFTKIGTWLKKLAILPLMLAVPSMVHADWTDVLSKFRPRLIVQEEYTDNLDLTATNKKEDYITTIRPGITFMATENREAKFGLDLDYLLGLNFYAHNSDKNYVSHNGTLNTWYTFGRSLTFRFWDYVIRSEDPEERMVTYESQPGVFYQGVQRERSIYVRNIAEPSLTYQFGREDQFSILYRNIYYQSESPNVEDSRGNSIIPRLTYWFDVNNGITLEYSFHTGDYERSPDFTGHRASARYTYRFSQRTAIFAEYVYDTLDYENPGIDYYVQNPSVGITYAFTPTLTGRAQVGYFWRIPDTGETTDGFTVDLGIIQRSRRTTLDLSVQGGYRYDLISSENLGFSQYYRGLAVLSQQLAERVSISFLGSLEWDDYSDRDRKDWVWRVGGDLSVRLLKWLSTSLGVSYRDNDSDQDNFDYREWRAFIRLTAAP